MGLQGNEIMPKKIVIMGSPFTGNYGTMALVIAAVQILNNVGLKVKFFKSSVIIDDDKRKYFHYFKDDFVVFGFNKRRLPLLVAIPLLLVYSIKYVRMCDLVLDIPGDTSNDVNLYSQITRFLLSKLFGKKFVVYAVSSGPFKYGITRLIANYYYRAVDFLVVREALTKRCLERLGVRKIMLTADLAFLLKKADVKDVFRKREGLGTIKPFIGISVKHNYERTDSYCRLIQEIAEYITSEIGTNVFFIPHEDDDKTFSKRIFEEIQNSKTYVLEGDFLPDELKTIIGESEFFIGSRIHACIAAISLGIPTMAIIPRNDHRVAGLMKLFSMNEFIFSPKDSPSKLLPFLGKAFEKREETKKRIAGRLEFVNRLSLKNALIIKDILQGKLW